MCYIVGICVIVIIGDNKFIAEVICIEIGVFKFSADVKGKFFIGCEFVVMFKFK